jgi:hypothetical protein
MRPRARLCTVSGATLAVAGLVAVAVASSSAPAATVARIASVGNPPAGQVEAIAVEVKGRFKHGKPPPAIRLALPTADQPAGVEILAQDRRTKVVGHLAHYLLLIEVLHPTSTVSALPAGGAANGPASLIAGFRGHFRKHGASKVVVTSDVFGASRRSLSAFGRRIRSLGAAARFNGLRRPALIDAGGLGLTPPQLSELGVLWKNVWTFLHKRHSSATGLEQLYAPFEADFAGMFTAPPGSTAPPTPTRPHKPGSPPTPPAPQMFGSTLTADPTGVALGNVDFALWQVGQQIPVSGQVTSISVRGYFAGGSCGAICQTNLHFQDLRPTSDGQLQVIATSAPFTLPTTLGTYTFALNAFKFRVQAGDYVGFSTIGGSWDVLAPAAGDQVAQFTGYNMDGNGATFSATQTFPGEQINMRVTVQPNS